MKKIKPFNIVLVEPEIPPNTGSIARLCGATNSVLHLIQPLGFNTDDKTLKRAGLDYWKHVKIKYWESFEDFLRQLDIEKAHFMSKKVSQLYTQRTFKPGDYLIFGKETKGLPEYILDNYPDKSCRLPMFNKNIRSLNLAMSCGIILYEALRQNSFWED